MLTFAPSLYLCKKITTKSNITTDDKKKCKNDPAVETQHQQQQEQYSLPLSPKIGSVLAVTSSFHIHIGTSFHHFHAHSQKLLRRQDLQNQTGQKARRETAKKVEKEAKDGNSGPSLFFQFVHSCSPAPSGSEQRFLRKLPSQKSLIHHARPQSSREKKQESFQRMSVVITNDRGPRSSLS